MLSCDLVSIFAQDEAMCNLYSLTKRQTAIIALTRAIRDITGNLPPTPGVFPDFYLP